MHAGRHVKNIASPINSAMYNNVKIEIKSQQIEITKTGGQYILLRKLKENSYVAEFSDIINETDIRRLVDTGVIEIINIEERMLFIETRRFNSTEMLYLILADLLNHKSINISNYEQSTPKTTIKN